MSRLWVRFGIALLVLAGVAGCGQKGPLYLPDQGAPADADTQQQEQQTATPPAS
jgi:predicted small lipoprotein YifL